MQREHQSIKQEYKNNANFKALSDKSRVEEINSQYALLEVAYHKLLSQVQKLQNTHITDMRNTESKFNASHSALQKALVSKTEELVHSNNKLAAISARYERESRQWAYDKGIMKSQLEELSSDFSSLEAKFEDRARVITHGNTQRQELAERVALREQDLVKYSKSLREKEHALKNEMEARSIYESKSRQFEEKSARLDIELSEVKEILERRTADLLEFENTKKILQDTKRAFDDLVHREKNYLAEIEQLSARERKLYAENEDLSSQQRKHINETSRLNVKISGLMQEIEIMKTVEINLRAELKDHADKFEQFSRQTKENLDNSRQSRTENARLIRELDEMQIALQESRVSNSNLHGELSKLRLSEDTLKKEKESVINQSNHFSSVLEDKRLEIDNLQKQVFNLTNQLESEILDKDEMRNQNKEKLSGVSLRISELQSNLAQTTLQMEEMQQTETQLRQLIRQKDESICTKTLQISELQDSIRSIESVQTAAFKEVEDIKSMKRDEFLSLQEKFSQAKINMQQEVANLRDQLSKKSAQLTAALDESNKLKASLNEFSSDRFSLESRLSELMASETSYQRQVSNLQIQVHSKNQDLQRNISKQQALEDQLKRLEDELNIYRNNGVTNDGDIQRLQSNMQQLSKRLKNQVETLLERDEMLNPATGHNRLPSAELPLKYSLINPPSITSSSILRQPTSNGPSVSAPRENKSVKITDDFVEIDRLLAKAPAQVN